MILADTNILLRSVHLSDPAYAITEQALRILRLNNEKLCIAPQNLVEYFAAATRPRSENGLGMDTAAAMREIVSARVLSHVLPYTNDVLETWQLLVSRHGISGKQVHDANIVAIMQVHSVKSILTFNYKHF